MTLDDRLQELSNYVYNAGALAKHNGIFVGGEPKKEATKAILSDLLEIINEDGHYLQLQELRKRVRKYCE